MEFGTCYDFTYMYCGTIGGCCGSLRGTGQYLYETTVIFCILILGRGAIFFPTVLMAINTVCI